MAPRNSPTPLNWLEVIALECAATGETFLNFAIRVYHDRQLKDYKERRFPPRGVRVGKGKTAIWYPVPYEVRSCCWGVAPPDWRYPWVYQRHCRTARHVAMLFNVDERDIVR